MMSFAAGLESTNVQKQQMWCWETAVTAATCNTQIPNPAQLPVLDGSNLFLDYPSSTPPMTSFPFYYPVQDCYHFPGQGAIKREDGDHSFAAAESIGLNLGGRTYFSSADAMAVDRLFRRTRGLYQLTQQVPRCQAEGCRADLSFAKHYHRRHKVCEFHSKATVVVVGELQQRFCQQCSRFHVLAEFDEAKRSCRRRLADHNRRRRKSQPPAPAYDDSSSNPSTTDKNKEIRNSKHMSAAAKIGSSSFSGRGNKDMENLEEDTNKVITDTRNGPDLSLGGAGREDGRVGAFGSQLASCQQRSFVTMSGEEEQNQQQEHFDSSPPSSATVFHPHHNFFCSSSNPAEHSAAARGGSDRGFAELGVFEVGFI